MSFNPNNFNEYVTNNVMKFNLKYINQSMALFRSFLMI